MIKAHRTFYHIRQNSYFYKKIIIMKRFLLIIASAIVLFPAQAQKTKVSESIEKIGDGKNNCLVVTIAGASEDDVAKAWKDKMKDTGGKVSGKKEMFVDDASLPSISSNTVDVYSVINEKGGDVVFMVGFNLGGAYLNSKEHASGYKVAEKMIYDFAVEQTKLAVQNKIDEQKNLIAKTTKDVEGLTKDNEKLAKDIEDYKKRIEEAEKNIESNKSSIVNGNQNIEDQNKALKELEKKLSEVD